MRGTKMLRIAAIIVVLSEGFSPMAAFAQDGRETEQTHWGITGSTAPSWEIVSGLKRIFDAPHVVLKGSEFQVGFARGRELGGDWGVSLVRKRITEATFDESEPICAFPRVETPGGAAPFEGFELEKCVRYGDLYTIKDAYVTGVEIHKYAPVVTIKRRVQIGMNFAGGVGAIQGEAEKRSQSYQFIYDKPGPGGRTIGAVQNEDIIVSLSAKQAFQEKSVLPFVPLGKAELVFGIMPAPGLKVKFSGGFNFPGVQRFSVGMSYLFGTRRDQ